MMLHLNLLLPKKPKNPRQKANSVKNGGERQELGSYRRMQAADGLSLRGTSGFSLCSLLSLFLATTTETALFYNALPLWTELSGNTR